MTTLDITDRDKEITAKASTAQKHGIITTAFKEEIKISDEKPEIDRTFRQHIKYKAGQVRALEVLFGPDFAILVFKYPYMAEGCVKNLEFWNKTYRYGIQHERKGSCRVLVTPKPLSQMK
jgi:hypothetical protein